MKNVIRTETGMLTATINVRRNSCRKRNRIKDVKIIPPATPPHASSILASMNPASSVKSVSSSPPGTSPVLRASSMTSRTFLTTFTAFAPPFLMIFMFTAGLSFKNASVLFSFDAISTFATSRRQILPFSLLPISSASTSSRLLNSASKFTLISDLPSFIVPEGILTLFARRDPATSWLVSPTAARCFLSIVTCSSSSSPPEI